MLIMFLEKSKGRKSNTNSTIYPQTKRKNTRHPPHTHLKKNTKKNQKPKEVEDRAVEERGGASKSTIGTWGEK